MLKREENVKHKLVLFFRELGFKAIEVKGFDSRSEIREFTKDPRIIPIKVYEEAE